MHWANHHFRQGHRAEENVIAGFNMVCIDVDGGIGNPGSRGAAQGVPASCSYTTKRHSPEQHRFRLMFPTNYFLELDQNEYKEFMNGIMGWLPFTTDASANQRAKKWESFPGGQYHYNMEGQLLDVLPFIPKTSRKRTVIAKQNQKLESLDNMERWFANRMVPGNRNNQMIKFALCLVDAGWDLPSVQAQVRAFDQKLSEPMGEDELNRSIFVTVAQAIPDPDLSSDRGPAQGFSRVAEFHPFHQTRAQ